MLTSQARRFGEALVDRHVMTREAVEEAFKQAQVQGGSRSFAQVVTDLGVSPADLAAGWAAALGVIYINFETTVVQPDATNLIPEALARAHHAVAVRIEQTAVVVAFAVPLDPHDVQAITEHLLAHGGHELIVGVSSKDELAGAMVAVHGGSVPDAVTAPKDSAARELDRLFERVLELGGSDLHLAAGLPPFVRVVGELVRMPDEVEMSATKVRELVYSILTVRQRERFAETNELDTSHAMGSTVRFRVNVFVQRNAIGAAFRVIPYDVVAFEQLGVPEILRTWAELPRGLVLVTGPTGSGKSTTLAALIDIVNRSRPCHIITIEDPVEFVHRSKTALVNQREIGADTQGFGRALTAALRQDPDVILVGEMRDLETISTAITAAETGHLVFGTLHTQDAASTVDRIIDVFPANQQNQVRTQLANSLVGVSTQQLIPTADGRSRAVACEVLIANTAIRALIRDGKIHQIGNAMASGKRSGMQGMDESLADLVRRGVITPDAAMRRAKNPDELARMIGVPLGSAPTTVA